MFRKPLLWIILALILGPLFIYFAYQEKREFAALAKDGTETMGDVRAVESTRRRKSRTTYKLTVAYQPEGRAALTKEFKVMKSFFNDLESSGAGKVTVRYLPSDPETAMIVGGTSTYAPVWIGAVITAFGVLGAGGMLLSLKKRRSVPDFTPPPPMPPPPSGPKPPPIPD